jgi:hypothetical protein
MPKNMTDNRASNTRVDNPLNDSAAVTPMPTGTNTDIDAANTLNDGIVRIKSAMSTIEKIMASLTLPERYRSFVWLILVTVLLYLNVQGIFTEHFDKKDNNYIAIANQAYLTETQKQAVKTYLLLAELDAGLSMLQSSRAGISFVMDVDIQVGRALKQINALVEKSTQVSLLAMGGIFVIEVLLKFCEWASPLIFTLLLIIAFCYCFLCVFMTSQCKVSRIVAALTSFILALFINVHLLFPLAVYGSGFAQKELTSEMAKEVHDGFSAAHQHMLGTDNKMGMRERVEHTIKQYEKVIVGIPHKVEHISSHFVRHIVVVIFNVILFPLLFLYIFSSCSMRMLEHMFDIARPFIPVGYKSTGTRKTA